MKTITLNSLVLKNFRSYKNEAVSFSETTGLKLLSGANSVEERLGSNGAGKSSLWDALCWCLFGTGIRGGKISSLLAWGEEKAEVFVILTIDGEIVSINRTGPPNKITIRGQVATQEQVDELIGLPKDRFLNSIIFGQGQPLFPDLSTAERGQLLDDVLNLDIWNRCSEAATKKYTSLNVERGALQIKQAGVEGNLNGFETEQEINYKLAIWDESRTSTIGDLKYKREQWKENIIRSAEDKERELSKLETEINEVVHTVADQTTGEEDQIQETEKILINLTSQYEDHRRIFFQTGSAYTSLQETEGFWKEDKCPSCLRPITKEMKEINLAAILAACESAKQDRDKAEGLSKLIDDQINQNRKILSKFKEASTKKQEKRKAAEREYNNLNERIKQLKKEGEKLVEEIEKNSDPYSVQIIHLQHQENPYTKTLLENKLKRRQLTTDLTKCQESIKRIESSLVAVEFWKTGFKRIRLYFIQQILTSLEIEIKSALSLLGLDSWQVSLTTESETKSGTTKLGVQVFVKSPTMEGNLEIFSGGEGQRLRLGIAIGLASLIQRAAGVVFNFTVFDEPTQFLSPEGIEDLLGCLESWAESNRKSVWLLDHRSFDSISFKEIWRAQKTVEGSKVSQLQ